MKKQIYLFILTIILLLKIASANEIGIISPFSSGIEITDWTESNKINGRDLQVNMVIELYIPRKLLNFSKEFQFQFIPGEDKNAGQDVASNVKFLVCEGSRQGYNYGEDIPINCNNELVYEKNETTRSSSEGYKKYNLIIDASKINFTYKNTIKRILIKINYIIPNFLEKGTEKLFIIKTNCFPNSVCPQPNNIIKSIVLPKEAALRNYPKDTVLHKSNGKLTLILNNFKPTFVPHHPRYASKVIMYTDLREEKIKNLLWGLSGIIITFVVSFILWLFIERKDQLKQQNKILNNQKKLSQVIKNVIKNNFEKFKKEFEERFNKKLLNRK